MHQYVYAVYVMFFYNSFSSFYISYFSCLFLKRRMMFQKVKQNQIQKEFTWSTSSMKYEKLLCDVAFRIFFLLPPKMSEAGRERRRQRNSIFTAEKLQILLSCWCWHEIKSRKITAQQQLVEHSYFPPIDFFTSSSGCDEMKP